MISTPMKGLRYIASLKMCPKTLRSWRVKCITLKRIGGRFLLEIVYRISLNFSRGLPTFISWVNFVRLIPWVVYIQGWLLLIFLTFLRGFLLINIVFNGEFYSITVKSTIFQCSGTSKKRIMTRWKEGAWRV